MKHTINGIKLPDENYVFHDDIYSKTDRIEFLSKINIFIGENNSGKSRLLRTLLSNELDYSPNSLFIKDYNEVIERLKSKFEDYFEREGLSKDHFKGIFKIFDEMNTIEFLNSSLNLSGHFIHLMKVIKGLESQGNISLQGNFGRGIPIPKIATDLMEIFKEETNVFGENFEDYLKPSEFKKIYIPILRGLKPINHIDGIFQYEDVYQARIKEDYFKDSKIPDEFEIFTGIKSYEEIRKFLLGNLSQRKLIAEYEDYLSKNFFDNRDVTLIPSEQSGVITVKVGDEKERPIYELGDGIQSIIIITMPLFLNKGKNLLFFIEEPEKLLHPGLQRKLIETLLNQEGFETYQYFITTHSNHFLDITLDFSGISIYTLRKELDEEYHDEKEPRFLIENLSQGDMSALELLGVRNSSVFLSNCTIWVEGITDRLYFRRYLELYYDHLKEEKKEFIEFKEDFHYSYVEYSGGNITHWSFLDKEELPMNAERLCGKLFLIADKDQGKEERHEKLREVLGDRFCLLECREVENLLSKKVLLKVIEEYEKEDPDIIEDFEDTDYKDASLGKFIDEKLKDKKRDGSYAAKSGTVSDKIGFCKKAIKHTAEWNDLSEETKVICERIYKFISETNGYTADI